MARTIIQAAAVGPPTTMTCPVCISGCDCRTRTPGCAHFACWGIDPGGTRCPDVAIGRAELAASMIELAARGTARRESVSA